METLRFLMATTFYPPYHLGGDAVHVQYLAQALAARGHEVHVEFAPAAYRLKRGRSMPPPPEPDGVHLHAIPSPMGRAQPVAAHVLGRASSVTRFHEDLVRAVRPDVVHLHNISLLGLGVAVRPQDATMVYTAHDYWARCPRSDLLKYGREPCEAPTCVRCALRTFRPPQLWRHGDGILRDLDVAIAPSAFMAAQIEGSLGCPVVHLPNFAPDPNPTGDVAEPEDYFLFVGVLERHKGIPELAAALRGSVPARVKVVGRGSLLAELRRLATTDAPVDVEGWVPGERLQRLYRRARGLLVPSTWQENAPLTAIESLAWGTPLIAARRGGLQELLHGGTAGRSFEPTAAGLAAALYLFEEEGLPRMLRRSARRAYEAHHRPETYVTRYLDVVRGASPHERDRRRRAPRVEVALASSVALGGGSG